ncbi:hypothetical protein C8R11_11313 [Nitrosomonas aestuarii]|nr:hypothetical protein C8R11_11313 [Nitrosomonas aestuarii]
MLSPRNWLSRFFPVAAAILAQQQIVKKLKNFMPDRIVWVSLETMHSFFCVADKFLFVNGILSFFEMNIIYGLLTL